VTKAPSALWTAQQLTEAFPYGHPSRYLRRDRDRIYGEEFVRRTRALGLQQKLIAARSPWQNPSVERIVGSIRRECLDHVIVLHAQHLQRVLADLLDYFHRHRTHRALDQDCPHPRPTEPPERGKIVVLPLLGGLHRRYTRRAA